MFPKIIRPTFKYAGPRVLIPSSVLWIISYINSNLSCFINYIQINSSFSYWFSTMKFDNVHLFIFPECYCCHFYFTPAYPNLRIYFAIMWLLKASFLWIRRLSAMNLLVFTTLYRVDVHENLIDIGKYLRTCSGHAFSTRLLLNSLSWLNIYGPVVLLEM